MKIWMRYTKTGVKVYTCTEEKTYLYMREKEKNHELFLL